MSDQTPPSISFRQQKGVSPALKLVLVLLAFPGVLATTLLALRVIGLIHPFYVPTGSMSPAVTPGDHVCVEHATLMRRKPVRGDIVVFSTHGIESLPQDELYIKRVAGLPGEQIRISNGKIYVDGKTAEMKNALGEISYGVPEQMKPMFPIEELTVPSGEYFVLGDNATNSLDSRSFGCVPLENIKGRVYFCYWPWNRVGVVR